MCNNFLKWLFRSNNAAVDNILCLSQREQTGIQEQRAHSLGQAEWLMWRRQDKQLLIFRVISTRSELWLPLTWCIVFSMNFLFCFCLPSHVQHSPRLPSKNQFLYFHYLFVYGYFLEDKITFQTSAVEFSGNYVSSRIWNLYSVALLRHTLSLCIAIVPFLT